MGQVLPVADYKRKLMSSIVTSPALISLIDDSYVVNGECVNADDEENGLIYKQIFPYYYTPQTQSPELSYIMMKVDGLGVTDNIYTSAEIYICAAAHQNIMRVNDSIDTRIDLMSEVIEELFNGREDFGFGKMKLASSTETDINSVIKGRVLKFVVEDFSTDACKNE